MTDVGDVCSLRLTADSATAAEADVFARKTVFGPKRKSVCHLVFRRTSQPRSDLLLISVVRLCIAYTVQSLPSLGVWTDRRTNEANQMRALHTRLCVDEALSHKCKLLVKLTRCVYIQLRSRLRVKQTT